MDIEQAIVCFALLSVAVWLFRQVRGWVRRRWPHVSLGDAMSGSVYIMWDRSFPDLNRTIIKIGVSRRRDIRERVEEVRDCMGGDPVCIWKMDHVPFPFAVEFVAHQYLSHWRVRWPKGSRRGREWFWVRGEAGMARARKAIEKACRRVRKAALARKRWSAKSDMYISIWSLSEGRVSRTYPFRPLSPQVETIKKPGGNGVRTANRPPPTPRCSGPRAAAVPGGRGSRGRTRT